MRETIEFEDCLGLIRVMLTPEGEAPKEIREKWIGVEIPCLYYEEDPCGTTGVPTGRTVTDSFRVYAVLQKTAISFLEEMNPETAEWWRNNGFPQRGGEKFFFDSSSVEETKPVLSRQEFRRLVHRLSAQIR